MSAHNFSKTVVSTCQNRGFKVELDQSGSAFYCNASLEPTDLPWAEDIKAEFQDKYCHNVTFLIANREKISDLIKCRRFWRFKQFCIIENTNRYCLKKAIKE